MLFHLAQNTGRLHVIKEALHANGCLGTYRCKAIRHLLRVAHSENFSPQGRMKIYVIIFHTVNHATLTWISGGSKIWSEPSIDDYSLSYQVDLTWISREMCMTFHALLTWSSREGCRNFIAAFVDFLLFVFLFLYFLLNNTHCKVFITFIFNTFKMSNTTFHLQITSVTLTHSN